MPLEIFSKNLGGVSAGRGKHPPVAELSVHAVHPTDHLILVLLKPLEQLIETGERRLRRWAGEGDDNVGFVHLSGG